MNLKYLLICHWIFCVICFNKSTSKSPLIPWNIRNLLRSQNEWFSPIVLPPPHVGMTGGWPRGPLPPSEIIWLMRCLWLRSRYDDRVSSISFYPPTPSSATATTVKVTFQAVEHWGGGGLAGGLWTFPKTCRTHQTITSPVYNLLQAVSW